MPAKPEKAAAPRKPATAKTAKTAPSPKQPKTPKAPAPSAAGAGTTAADAAVPAKPPRRQGAARAPVKSTPSASAAANALASAATSPASNPAATPALARHLAATLQRLRAERGWSLDRAAGETGVSKAMLGQIERAESSPTVATLWRIASGFRTPLTTFIEAPPELPAQALFRAAAALRGKPASDEMWVAPLFPYDPRLGFELLELTLAPGYERRSEPHLGGVVEHVIVVRGSMEVLVDGRWRKLGEGEAVRFAADRTHGYRNRGAAPAVCHNLICYAGSSAPVADDDDRPAPPNRERSRR